MVGTLSRALRYLARLRDSASQGGKDAGRGRLASDGLIALTYAVPLALVAAVTAALFTVRAVVSNDLIALTYVFLVVLMADLGPTRGWWVAPVSAGLALDYFFTRPYYSFFVSSPHDIVMLVLFLLVGVISSRQVERLRHRTRQAEERQHDVQLLNTLSTALVSTATSEDMARRLRDALRAVGMRRVVLFVANAAEGDGRHTLLPLGDAPEAVEAQTARWVMRENKAIGIPRSPDEPGSSEPWPVGVAPGEAPADAPPGAFVPLLSAKRLEGVLYADPGINQPALIGRESRLIVSAANLVATFLERRELQKEATAAALLRESDRLKSNLVAGVSHDIKTPLAAAKALVTHLLIGDVSEDSEQRAEDLTATVAALDRLGAMIDDLIDLSRLESDGWRQKLEVCEPGELLSALLTRLGPDGDRVRIELSAAPAAMLVDFGQMERAIRNLVTNALVYSSGLVRVAITQAASGIVVSVEDEGPGVDDSDKASVFEKFYRGLAAQHVPGGSGLGLAIVREVAHAHGGAVAVEDVAPHGARFSIVLPPSAADRIFTVSETTGPTA